MCGSGTSLLPLTKPGSGELELARRCFLRFFVQGAHCQIDRPALDDSEVETDGGASRCNAQSEQTVTKRFDLARPMLTSHVSAL